MRFTAVLILCGDFECVRPVDWLNLLLVSADKRSLVLMHSAVTIFAQLLYNLSGCGDWNGVD